MSENDPIQRIIAEETAKARSGLLQTKANISELLKHVTDEETKKKFEDLSLKINEIIEKL